MSKKDYKRLQFDFSEEAVTRLDELVKKTDSSTRAELVRRSLRFFEYVSDMAKEGYRVELAKEDEKIALAPLLVV